MILRDKDLANGWSGTPDGVLEDRVYYCQNWRADVSAVINPYGEVVETAKFASYGTPICLPAGDVDADGDNSGDYNQINTWIGLSQYHTQGDVNMDGVLDSADASLAMATDGTAAGRGVMSTAAVASRKGYAGYENDGVVSRFSHVRHRVLDSLLGRWTRRDPAGYVDGTHLMVFGRSNSIRWMDPTGWLSQSSDWNLCVEISLDYASCLECCPSGFALTFGPSCKETCRSKYLLTPVIPIPDYKLPNLIIPSRPTWPPYELPPRRIGPDPERFLPPEQDHRCILFRVVAHPDGTFSIECMVDIPF